MASLNKVMLIGNLTRDPELRYTPSGSAVCEFGLAMNRAWKSQDGNKQEETTFVDITAWGKTAEFVNQYLTKGRRIFVEGRLKYDQWTSPEGQKRSKLTVVAETVQFLDAKGDGGGAPGGRPAAAGSRGAPSRGGDDYGGPIDGPDGPGDDDIPF
jgi:single-strand DNA-binding protein